MVLIVPRHARNGTGKHTVNKSLGKQNRPAASTEATTDQHRTRKT